MLYCKSICFSVMLLSLLVFTQSCNKKTAQRYISETDTSYSLDIRNVSKKINADPENAELYYLRGNAFYFLDQFSDAEIDLVYLSANSHAVTKSIHFTPKTANNCACKFSAFLNGTLLIMYGKFILSGR